MLIQRYKLKKKLNGDVSVKLPLSANNNISGFQDSINDFIESETGLSINPADDGEKFRYLVIRTLNYRFNFYNSTTGTFSRSLENAGFSESNIINADESIFKSFFILQVYDTFDSKNQILLHTAYLNGFNFLRINDDITDSTYSITNDLEFSTHYYPNTFIDQLNGNVVTLYIKCSFYNSITGKFQLFFNEDREDDKTEEKFYHRIEVNVTNKSYDVINISATDIDFKESINTDFVDKVNETIESFSNEKPTFPDGNAFVREDGGPRYEDVDEL